MKIFTYRQIFWILALILVAFVVRVAVTAAFVGLNSPPDAGATADQVEYENNAYQLSQGHGYVISPGNPTTYRPPGTSYLLAPIYVVFGRSYAAGRIWFCLLSALTCGVVFLIGDALWDRRIGALAAIWLVFYPGHFYHAMHFVSEGPYGLFLAAAAGLTILSLKRKSTAFGIGAGLLWGIGVLIRPQLIFVLPLACLAVIWNRSSRQVYLRLVAIQMVVASLVIGCWVVRNKVVMGAGALGSTAGVTFWGAHNDVVFADPALAGGWVRPSLLFDRNHFFVGGEFVDDARAWRYGIDWVKANPSRMPWLYFKKITRLLTPFPLTENRAVYWATAFSWGITGPLVALGLIVALRRGEAAVTVLALPLIGLLLNCFIFYSNSRFRDSVAPLYVIFATIGFLALFDATVRARRTFLERPSARKIPTGRS
jgi:4-amino-4-deoxy-L-arabinose transferase-like glycosyltransferase